MANQVADTASAEALCEAIKEPQRDMAVIVKTLKRIGRQARGELRNNLRR